MVPGATLLLKDVFTRAGPVCGGIGIGRWLQRAQVKSQSVKLLIAEASARFLAKRSRTGGWLDIGAEMPAPSPDS